jgi:hypothetical protein
MELEPEAGVVYYYGRRFGGRADIHCPCCGRVLGAVRSQIAKEFASCRAGRELKIGFVWWLACFDCRQVWEWSEIKGSISRSDMKIHWSGPV